MALAEVTSQSVLETGYCPEVGVAPEIAELLTASDSRRHQSIYLLNTMACLAELSAEKGRRITVGGLTDSDLEQLTGGCDWLYALGIWKRGFQARQMALSHKTEYFPVRASLKDEEIVGSAFAATGLEIDPRIASSAEEWRSFRNRLNRNGIGMIIDGVFNHTGVDDSLATSHPELFIQVQHGCGFPVCLRNGKTVYLAQGTDPNFPGGWEDTLQLNWANPATHKVILRRLRKIAAMADGVRLDMAMLINPRTFERTWGGKLSLEEIQFLRNHPFWPRAVTEIHKFHPDFRFLAEAYWDSELLQQWGLDVYAKEDLYNLAGRVMSGEPVSNLREFIRCWPESSRNHSIRFLENHDERRAYELWGQASLPLAVVVSLTPGGYFLIHDGQERGYVRRVPMQVSRYGEDVINPHVASFYRDLLAFRDSRIFQEGNWELTDIFQCGLDQSNTNLFGHSFTLNGNGVTVLSNLRSGTARGYVSVPDRAEVAVYDPQQNRWLAGEQIATVINGLMYVELPGFNVQYICYVR